MSEKSKPFLLGVAHAARELKISEKRLRQLADRGDVPHMRDSEGRRVFTEKGLAQYREQYPERSRK